jgi:two-component system, LytTR family, sensor histidine kinase AlgZ
VAFIQRRGAQALAWTIGGSLAATFAFMNGSSLSWPRIIEQTLGNILFSGCCVVLCLVGLPRVVPFAHRRLRFPFDWLLIVGAIVAFGVMGSFVAGLAAIVIGVTPRGRPFMSWYPGSMKVSVYFTVIFGLSGTMIQQLRSRLASTTLALRTKERDEAEARRLVAEAQLASLESRVDPHFLFNTLNSIAALVREKPADAERVIEQLASLMRSSLDRRASLVPIDEELDIVRSYLEIERVRFGDRLRFRIAPLAGGGAPLVPRLSLQTLVENSVKYAVSAARDGASLSVTATASNGRLRVAVEDDGPGFDVSGLPEGHGLRLLQSRLAMTFGERGTLLAESRPGRTVVTLELPFETVTSQAPPAPVATVPKDRGC